MRFLGSFCNCSCLASPCNFLHTLSLICYSCAHFYLYPRLELWLIVAIFPHKAVLKKWGACICWCWVVACEAAWRKTNVWDVFEGAVMRQNRALIAKFTCAWMYQRLFRLFNNSALGSFHHLPSLPPLLPALLTTRAEHFVGIVERITPTLESDQPLPPCKSNFFSPGCLMGDTAESTSCSHSKAAFVLLQGRVPLRPHSFKHFRGFVLALSN